MGSRPVPKEAESPKYHGLVCIAIAFVFFARYIPSLQDRVFQFVDSIISVKFIRYSEMVRCDVLQFVESAIEIVHRIFGIFVNGILLFL